MQTPLTRDIPSLLSLSRQEWMLSAGPRRIYTTFPRGKNRWLAPKPSWISLLPLLLLSRKPVKKDDPLLLKFLIPRNSNGHRLSNVSYKYFPDGPAWPIWKSANLLADSRSVDLWPVFAEGDNRRPVEPRHPASSHLVELLFVLYDISFTVFLLTFFFYFCFQFHLNLFSFKEF